jgi:hypothetical protein
MPVMSPSKLRVLFLSALSALFLTLAAPMVPAVASPTPAERAPADVQATSQPEQATRREVSRYAERERQAGNLETFEGGRTVIVIGSLGALLLGALLVLLLV